MPAPIDYGVQIADPTQAFLGAFQTGASIQEARLKQEQQQQQIANQKLIQEGFAKLRQPNATAADYANLSKYFLHSKQESQRSPSAYSISKSKESATLAMKLVLSFWKLGVMWPRKTQRPQRII